MNAQKTLVTVSQRVLARIFLGHIHAHAQKATLWINLGKVVLTAMNVKTIRRVSMAVLICLADFAVNALLAFCSTCTGINVLVCLFLILYCNSVNIKYLQQNNLSYTFEVSASLYGSVSWIQWLIDWTWIFVHLWFDAFLLHWLVKCYTELYHLQASLAK